MYLFQNPKVTLTMPLSNIKRGKKYMKKFIEDCFLRNKVKAKSGSVWSQRTSSLTLQQPTCKAGHSFMQSHPWRPADSSRLRALKDPSAVLNDWTPRSYVRRQTSKTKTADSKKRYQGRLQSQRLALPRLSSSDRPSKEDTYSALEWMQTHPGVPKQTHRQQPHYHDCLHLPLSLSFSLSKYIFSDIHLDLLSIVTSFA